MCWRNGWIGRVEGLLFCILLAVCSSAEAQTKPDFTGQWELSIEESRNTEGRSLPYTFFSLTVVHNEPSLYVLQEIRFGPGKVRKLRLRIKTDGKEHFIDDTTASARWEGETLVLRYGGDRPQNGGAVEVVRRMTLDPGGQRMHADMEFLEDGRVTPVSGSEIWTKSRTKTSPADRRGIPR